MSDKFDPTEFGNTSPQHKEIEAGHKGIVPSRSPNWGEGFTESVKQFFETLRHFADRVRDQKLRFLLTSFLIYVGFVGWFLKSKVIDYLDIAVILLVGIIILVPVRWVFMDDKRIGERGIVGKKDQPTLENSVPAESHNLPLRVTDKTEYKLFQDQFEKVLQKHSNKELVRQIDKNILQYFLQNQIREELINIIVEKKIASLQWLDSLHDGNEFFELDDNGAILRVQNRWANNTSSVAAVWLTVNNRVYEKNSKDNSIFIIDPLRLGKNLWDFPNNEILFYAIHICNARTVNRTVIQLLGHSQLQSDSQKDALILASRIVELQPDKVKSDTIANLLRTLRNHKPYFAEEG